MFRRQLTATYLQQLLWSFVINSHDPVPQDYFCNLRSASRPGKQGKDKAYPLSYPTDGQSPYRSFLQELFIYCGRGLPTGALFHFINLQFQSKNSNLCLYAPLAHVSYLQMLNPAKESDHIWGNRLGMLLTL